jgi:hypothetical protein
MHFNVRNLMLQIVVNCYVVHLKLKTFVWLQFLGLIILDLDD